VLRTIVGKLVSLSGNLLVRDLSDLSVYRSVLDSRDFVRSSCHQTGSATYRCKSRRAAENCPLINLSHRSGYQARLRTTSSRFEISMTSPCAHLP